MPRIIQLRNVPDDLDRLLTARAALIGLSLSEYLRADIRPTPRVTKRYLAPLFLSKR